MIATFGLFDVISSSTATMPPLKSTITVGLLSANTAFASSKSKRRRNGLSL
jgi:hypothetical protein